MLRSEWEANYCEEHSNEIRQYMQSLLVHGSLFFVSNPVVDIRGHEKGILRERFMLIKYIANTLISKIAMADCDQASTSGCLAAIDRSSLPRSRPAACSDCWRGAVQCRHSQLPRLLANQAGSVLALHCHEAISMRRDGNIDRKVLCSD